MTDPDLRCGLDALPVSTFQRMMLEAASDTEATIHYHQNFMVQWCFRITPSVSQRVLSRAFDKLVTRHDSLRLRFEKINGDWRAVVMKQHPKGLIIHDLGHCCQDEKDHAIATITKTPMTATSTPLFEMHLLKCGKAGDLIITRAQHAIIDGYSVILMIEELLKSALNMPVTRDAVTHRSFASQMERERQVHLEQKTQFWYDRLLPVADPLPIGRVGKGLPPLSRSNVGKTKRMDNVLSKEESQNLERLSKRIKCSVFSCVHTAFSQALCNITGGQEAVVCSWLGRADSQNQSFVGSAIQLIALKYHTSEDTFEEKARWVSDQIAHSNQGLPTDVFIPGFPLSKIFEEKNNSLYRFCVHNELPSAKLTKSKFAKLFWAGLTKKVSLGFASIEKLPIKRESEGEFEIYVLVNNYNEGPNVSFVFDAAAYDLEEIEEIISEIKIILEL